MSRAGIIYYAGRVSAAVARASVCKPSLHYYTYTQSRKYIYTCIIP